MVTLEAAGKLCSLLKCRPLIMTLTANCQRMLSAAITNKLHREMQKILSSTAQIQIQIQMGRYTDTQREQYKRYNTDTSAKTACRRLKRGRRSRGGVECAEYNAQCTNDKYALQKRDDNNNNTSWLPVCAYLYLLCVRVCVCMWVLCVRKSAEKSIKNKLRKRAKELSLFLSLWAV